MKIKVIDLDQNEVGSIELDQEIFGLEVRPDIIKSVIDWQLAKRQSGTHHTKTISEVSGTTKKPHAQKGTGKARQGSLRQVHMRGGATSHGPRVRSHAFSLNKKVRKLGLMHALSAKNEESRFIVVKNLDLVDAKTSILKKKLDNFSFESALFIDGNTVSDNFLKASSNMHKFNVLPQIGANVYDVVKHDFVVMTEEAIKILSERLK